MWYLVHQAETVQREVLQLWTSSIFHIRQEKGESWMLQVSCWQWVFGPKLGPSPSFLSQ